MKAFLLAAGFGERLRPLTNTMPKPLIPVAGIPSICYALCILKSCGIETVVCNVHYLREKVIDFIRRHENFGLEIIFSEEEEILGTGGGLKYAENFLNDDDFVLINSDIAFDLDLENVIENFYQLKTPGLVVVTESSPDAATVSVAEGRIVDFKGALGSGEPALFDYTGAAVLSPEIFNYLIPEFSSVVYTGYTGLITNSFLSGYHHRGPWIDVGTPESLENARIILRGEMNDFFLKVEDFYRIWKSE